MLAGSEVALLILLIVATATDLLWGKIYNWLTFPFLFLGILARVYTSGSFGLIEALFSVGVAFVLFFPLFLFKAVAAGDAKLLMAVGAWTNAKTTITIAALAILFGAAVGLVSLLRQKGLRGSAHSIRDNLQKGEPTQASLKMAFGPAFFCAYLVVSIAANRNWEIL